MLLNIADIILRIAKEKGKSLTPMQLMKLTYIANGWYLAQNDVPLFHERIEAWKYGPVMPELYQATKKFGKQPIPLDLIADNFDDLPSELERKVEFLKQVYGLYESLDGIQLSNKTHKKGTPWDKVYCPYSYGVEITESIIKEHYKELLHEQRAS